MGGCYQGHPGAIMTARRANEACHSTAMMGSCGALESGEAGCGQRVHCCIEGQQERVYQPLHFGPEARLRTHAHNLAYPARQALCRPPQPVHAAQMPQRHGLNTHPSKCQSVQRIAVVACLSVYLYHRPPKSPLERCSSRCDACQSRSLTACPPPPSAAATRLPCPLGALCPASCRTFLCAASAGWQDGLRCRSPPCRQSPPKLPSPRTSSHCL